MSYKKSAKFYDALYRAMGKDYEAEAAKIHELIDAHKRSPGNALLDIACGTGLHLEHLRMHYDVEGLDLEDEMLDIAMERLQDVPLHQADFRDFDLNRQYDALICLFSSIGYAQSVDELHSTIGSMCKHLVSGGVIIIEPWFSPEQWNEGHLHAVFVDEPDLKVCRMNLSEREGDLAVMRMNFEVGTPEGIFHFEEVHKMALFNHEEYLAAFHSNSLDVTYDKVGLMGRGLYIGVKS